MKNSLQHQQTGAPLSYEELEAELKKPVVTWKPHRDKTQPRTIIGRVVDRYTKTSDYKATDGLTVTYPVLVVEDDRSDTAWVAYCSAAQLKGKVERHDPRIGDLMGIHFAGFADENDPEKSSQRWNLKIAERTANQLELPTADFVEEGGDGDGGGEVDDDVPF
jgi:hypothetical protein